MEEEAIIMTMIIDDRNQEWFRKIMKVVKETPGCRKAVQDRVSNELKGEGREQSATKKERRARPRLVSLKG